MDDCSKLYRYNGHDYFWSIRVGSPNQRQSKAANCNGVTSKSMPSQSQVYVLIETVQTGLNGVSVVHDWMGHHNGILTVDSPAPPHTSNPLLRDTANGCWMRYLLPAVIEFTSLLNFYVPRNRRRVIRGLPLRYFSLHWITSISRKKYICR